MVKEKYLWVCKSHCVNMCVDSRPHKHDNYCKVKCNGKSCRKIKMEVATSDDNHTKRIRND